MKKILGITLILFLLFNFSKAFEIKIKGPTTPPPSKYFTFYLIYKNKIDEKIQEYKNKI